MIFENKTLKNFIPFIGTLLIVVGYLKISLFYKHFNIEIINYLEFSEILTIFLPDILKYCLFIFLGIGANFLLESKSETEKYHNIKVELTNSIKLKDRFKNHYNLNKELVWLSILILFIYLISFIWLREKFWDTLMGTFIIPSLLLFNILLLEFRNKYKILYNKYFDPTINNIILLIFLFGLLTVSSVHSEIKETESKQELKITFSYLNETLNTSKSLKYVGQTRNFLFLYDLKKKESRIFEISELRNYKITKCQQSI
jgi:hypothetical protein